MNVSIRNTILAGAALSAFLILGGTAAAGGMGGAPASGSGSGCTSGCGTGPVAPPTPTGRPNNFITGPMLPTGPVLSAPGLPAPQSGPGCCAGRGNLNVVVPGVSVGSPSVSIGGPSFSLGAPTLNVDVTGGGSVTSGKGGYAVAEDNGLRTQRQQAIYGGGGGGFVSEPGPTSQITLQGEPERFMETVTEQVPVTEQVCVPVSGAASTYSTSASSTMSYAPSSVATSLRPVQAVCLDDKGTPHPASRLSDDERVDARYSGEIFRCMSGTAMQVTLGSYDGKTSSFARGETFSCKKGEALVHAAGGGVSCAAQTEARTCNERSLLRRYGPGTKLIESRAPSCVMQTRTTYKAVTRQVERVRPMAAKPLMLTGGVGNGVN